MARLSNNWLALSCLLACVAALWSTRKYYAVCTLLLCAGPIEGCSAVLAVRRYYGFRSLVCASWCSEEEKQVQKQKLRCLCSLEAILLAELMIQLALSPRRAPPQQSCSPRGWYSPVPWLGLKRAPVLRTCHTYTKTRARFLLLDVLWCCYCIAGSDAASTLRLPMPIPLSSLLITCNEKTKEKKKSQKAKKTKNFGKVLFPNN